ncbi:MAG: hypothetical protein COB53_01700 [Elusimicrobia bacterium]|nr:MAG: hypothetical protein COB53_01700 [Elusimicrobiota bacterium]
MRRLGFIIASLVWAQTAAAKPGLRIVRSQGDVVDPLVTLFVQVRTGSARDPKGLEGLARLTARMVIEGGFGDRSDPITKERLAEITRPWGGRATPRVRIGKEATTFAMTVPVEVLGEFIERIFTPMFTQPLFVEDELDRLRGEARESLQALRLEQIESMGLKSLDAMVHEGGGRAHPTIGTMRGLGAVEQRDVRGYFAAYYVPENTTLGVAGIDDSNLAVLQKALSGYGKTGWRWIKGRTLSAPRDDGVSRAVIVALPNAISTGLHAAVPIEVTRSHEDYWPLYVANVWLGTHRDSLGRLYTEIRDKRGYNYGNYSYMEHFADRPSNLFPPPNTPRLSQYFSLWIRPVDHKVAGHLLRALSWEFERFARGTMTEEDCGAAKKKARVLYLSLAETKRRILASRIDDAFYGISPGWLGGYLDAVEGVSCTEMNDAVRRHLKGKALDYLIVTDDDEADRIAASLVDPKPAYGKGPADYQVDERDGAWTMPEKKLEMIRQDAVWAHHDLGLRPGRVRIVAAENVFKGSEVLP